jgi:2-(1,2-epoxy-1,2-dihydrophenyl)acetyl-CoA isomerase
METTMSYETILTDVDNGILTITLNRPERLNAWTYQMGGELAAAITDANANDDIIAIVVTGAGRGFCAGADIEAVFKAQSEQRGNVREGARAGDWVELIRSSKPIVAAINGAAIGVGLTQVLPMDLLLAARGAKLSVRFIKMGLVPELASSHYLALRVGFGNASELMLTGKTITAEEAFTIGLVDKLVEPGDLLTAAKSAARAMGENPQTALKMVKQLLSQNVSEGDTRLVQQREIAALTECYASPEHKEAISAFLEKREPDFKSARSRTT